MLKPCSLRGTPSRLPAGRVLIDLKPAGMGAFLQEPYFSKKGFRGIQGGLHQGFIGRVYI